MCIFTHLQNDNCTTTFQRRSFDLRGHHHRPRVETHQCNSSKALRFCGSAFALLRVLSARAFNPSSQQRWSIHSFECAAQCVVCPTMVSTLSSSRPHICGFTQKAYCRIHAADESITGRRFPSCGVRVRSSGEHLKWHTHTHIQNTCSDNRLGAATGTTTTTLV